MITFVRWKPADVLRMSASGIFVAVSYFFGIRVRAMSDTIIAEKRATSRERVVRVLAHVICIGMLFILPEILSSMGRPFRNVPELKLGVYAKALVFIAVFYVNYCFIIGRSFERKKIAWRLVGYNLGVIALSLALFWLISLWMQPYWDEAWRIRQAAKGLTVRGVHEPRHPGWLHWLKFFSRDFVMLVLTIGLSIALKLSDIWIRMSRRQEQLQSASRQEELSNLKNQLNPHFLFNTLNSIYALIDISPSKAQEAVHELSGMLRYVLYDNPREVELKRELDFVRNYVKLMALRLPPSIKVSCRLEAGGHDKSRVAPLLFIPLVENAFKHGNTGVPGAEIGIEITASGGNVRCITTNPCHTGLDRAPRRGYADDASAADEKLAGAVAGDTGEAGGIGLRNLRRRLHLIYGGDASLETFSEGRVFKAILTIRLPDPSAAAMDICKS